MRWSWVSLVFLPLGALSLLGCPNPNTYGTPRTVPAGKVQILVSAEGVGARTSTTTTNIGGTPVTIEGGSFYAPTLPSVGVRIGVFDWADIGLRFSQLSALEADVKLNFLKTKTFDMAVAPGVQGSFLSVGFASLGTLYFNAPLLLGINFSRATTLVLTPGFTYYVVTAGVVTNSSGSSTFESGSEPMARMGIGFNIRVGNRFAVQPEVTALKGFDAAEPLWWNFGLGFLFGATRDAMPIYSRDE